MPVLDSMGRPLRWTNADGSPGRALSQREFSRFPRRAQRLLRQGGAQFALRRDAVGAQARADLRQGVTRLPGGAFRRGRGGVLVDVESGRRTTRDAYLEAAAGGGLAGGS